MQTIEEARRTEPRQIVRNLVKEKQYELARRAAHIFDIQNLKNEIEENHVMDILMKHEDSSGIYPFVENAVPCVLLLKSGSASINGNGRSGVPYC